MIDTSKHKRFNSSSKALPDEGLLSKLSTFTIDLFSMGSGKSSVKEVRDSSRREISPNTSFNNMFLTTSQQVIRSTLKEMHDDELVERDQLMRKTILESENLDQYESDELKKGISLNAGRKLKA
jgi:hypothetical protein